MPNDGSCSSNCEALSQVLAGEQLYSKGNIICTMSYAMSTADIVIPSYESSVIHAKWIIGRRDDLIWFVGSALTGYLALAVISGAYYKPAAVLFTLVWNTLISGPHFFATASRTYFDAEQRRKLGRFLWLIVPFQWFQ